MNSVKFSDYRPYMGILIDVRERVEFNQKHHAGSINIPYNDLIFNHKKYLDKNKVYFLICSGGVKSKRAANILRVYGYNVKSVIN